MKFGLGPSDNYIENVETGKKIPMERGGSFVVKAHFVKELGAKESGPGFTRQAR